MHGNSAQRHHHHDSLREALVDAGIALLNEGGQSALTLRKCAAAAGVSHAAPAHHFQGLSGLLTAIAARGYRTLAQYMIDAREAAPPDLHVRLVATCNGYLRFAQEHEALFDLMFSTGGLSYDDPELHEASAAAYQVLHEGCAPFKHGSAGNEGTEIMIWSLVHGFACLLRKSQPNSADPITKGLGFEDILPHLDVQELAETAEGN